MNLKKLELLNGLFEHEIEQGRLKGNSIKIIQKNQEYFTKAYGVDREDSIYRIFSMTKPIIAVGIMILMERGMLELGEAVSKYFPGFCNQKVWNNGTLLDVKREVTIRDLLNMTSGIPYVGTTNESEKRIGIILQDILHKLANGKKPELEEFCNQIGQVPLVFQPGERWYYGYSADILGGIIQVVSKKSLGTFLKEEIFEPLGMEDTGFMIDVSKKERLAMCFTQEQQKEDTFTQKISLREATKKELLALALGEATEEPILESGGGGLYSTLEDYSKFATMLLKKGTLGENQILGRKTVEFMTSNQMTPVQKESIFMKSIVGYGYGNLLRIMIDKGEAVSNGSIGEYGWDGMAGTYFMVDPQEELILIYMQQNIKGGDKSLRRKMRQIVYGALD